MISQIPEPYRQFLEKLLADKHKQEIPEKLKDDMMVDLYSRLLHHLLLSYLQVLPDESADAFEKMMDGEPDSTVTQKFLQDNIPNLDDVTDKSLQELSNVYLGKS